MRAFRAREEDLPREAIERRAGASWDEQWSAVWHADPARAGTKEDYVLLFRVIWEEMLERYKKRIRLPPLPPLAPGESREEQMLAYFAAVEPLLPLPIEVGETLDELRIYFGAPDLGLPEGVQRVHVRLARHIPSGETFHLLMPADASPSDPPAATARPILACRSLMPGSALAPSTNRGTWADAQMWLMKGEHRLIVLGS